MIKEKLILIFENNSGKIIGSLIGLILAIFILILGLFKTLLIVILTGIGFFIGYKMDRGESVIEFLKKLSRINKDNI